MALSISRASGVRRQIAARLRASLSRLLPGLLLVLAFILPPLLAGGVGVARAIDHERIKTPPALAQPLPARPIHDPTKLTAVVVMGNAGTESSDLMGPYEALAASGRFNVYVAAPERTLAPLYPGDLAIVPHYSFSEYDAAFPAAPDLLVVPYIPNAATADPAVLDWIRAKAGAGTIVLSICGGSRVVADAGVLAGQTATSHHTILPIVLETHPEVTWVSGLRYVDSGQFISSAGVTSGVDATLYTLGRMFGRDVAVRTAQTIGYPHLGFLDDPTWDVQPFSFVPGLPGLYRLQDDDIGLVLYDGVGELEVSSAIDTYPRAFDTAVHTIAPERMVIHTRHGLTLVPHDDFLTAPVLDRLLVLGRAPSAELRESVEAWTARRGGPAVETIHAGDAYLYDATLRDMARHQTNAIAIEAARVLEYPTRDLALNGPTVRLGLLLRPVALGLLGLAAALWLRRRPAVPSPLGGVARFALHFAEMWIAMVAGMAAFHLAVGAHDHGAAKDATWLAYELGMMVFMTLPMLAWMQVRGHSPRHGLEMAAGMLAPVVAIDLLLGLGAATVLPWLQQADGPAMLLGMLAIMLLRVDHYAHRDPHRSPVVA